MDVYIQSEIGSCTEFVSNGRKNEISIVVSPLKITQDENVLKVNFGCNMWRACQNTRCQYSLVAHPPKTEAPSI